MLKKIHLHQLKFFLGILFLYFFWLMLRLTLDYVPARSSVSFLLIKQTEVASRPEYLPIFYTHVYTGIFVLITGFLAILRKNFGIKKFHAVSGKIYVLLILLFAAPAGIYMGVFANGGIFSKISFILLGILWWLATYKAHRLAQSHRFEDHKCWMWRSYALTMSAVTLRMWKVVLVGLFHPGPMEVYQIIAWLGWVPNLILIEILISKKLI